MLKGLAKKWLSFAIDRSSPPLLPPSSEEKAFLSELQTAIREFPSVETENLPPSQMTWLSNMNRLRELVLNQDPREFLRWDVVSQTMFISYSSYIFTELKYLRRLSDWRVRWRAAIKESSVGRPIPYIFYPASSANLIHHAYHLAQFEEKTGARVDDMDLVFEFGGGYGSMCRLFHNLGFRGRYVIFDLPLFSALQVYFLKTLGLPVRPINDFVAPKAGVVCVSDYQSLKAVLKDQAQAKNSMFLATWSLSESPISIRDTILPSVSDFQSFLVAYQDRFEEVNNQDFFGDWRKTISDVAWHAWRIEHIPGSNYLVGSELRPDLVSSVD